MKKILSLMLFVVVSIMTINAQSIVYHKTKTKDANGVISAVTHPNPNFDEITLVFNGNKIDIKTPNSLNLGNLGGPFSHDSYIYHHQENGYNIYYSTTPPSTYNGGRTITHYDRYICLTPDKSKAIIHVTDITEYLEKGPCPTPQIDF